MFVKVYRYRVRPDATEHCPGVEIQWWPDEGTHRRTMARMDAHPEIGELWREPQSTLADPEIVEESYEEAAP